MSHEQQIDPINEWVILHQFDGELQLVAAGRREFDPNDSKKLRNRFHRVTRAILLPSLEIAAQGTCVNRTAELQGERFTIIAKPIHTPDRSMVIGVYGIASPTSAKMPTEPLIGTWQWRTDEHGNNVGENASVWDDNLHLLHDFPREAVTSERGPAGDWTNRLIPYQQRPRVWDFVKNGLKAAHRKPLRISFGAITGIGTPNPGLKQLTLLGTAMLVDADTGERFAYGFTRANPNPPADQATAMQTMDASQFARAYIELNTNLAFAALDCEQDTVFMTSPSWAEHGLHEPFEGPVTALTDRDDRTALDEYLHAIRNGSSANPVTVALTTEAGTPRRFTIRAARVDPETPASYLLLALEAQP